MLTVQSGGQKFDVFGRNVTKRNVDVMVDGEDAGIV